jgi:putative transposase
LHELNFLLTSKNVSTQNNPKPTPVPIPSFGLPPGPSIGQSTAPAKKDWPHAPVHRLSENAVYIVTGSTLNKAHLFNTPAKRDLLERTLLRLCKETGWHLEAWAVMNNHYHFVARGNQTSVPLGEVLHNLHYDSASDLNALDGVPARTVWFQYWDTRLTDQYSYLCRLNYVHQNPVRHGLVPVANQYEWCSAAWFERTASPAQIKTIYSFKIDKVNVLDDF